MLLLLSKDVNVCEITKLLVKYKIKAQVVDQKISIDGPLPDELLTKLTETLDIIGVRNYSTEEAFETYSCYLTRETKHAPMNIASPKRSNIEEPEIAKAEEATETVVQEEATKIEECVEEIATEEAVASDKDNIVIPLKAPERIYERRRVKRGQIYRCDLGPMFGSEQGGVRPVIIIQNDTGNKYSPTTIVIPLTTQCKSNYIPTQFKFKFTEENMVDYSKWHPGLSSGYSTALAEQIQTIDKSRLICYLGTMTDKFMDELAHFICTSISLPEETLVEEPKTFKVVSEPIKIVEVHNEPAKEVAKPEPAVSTPEAKPSYTPPSTPKSKKKKTTFKRDPDYDPREKQIRRLPAEPPKPVPVVKTVEELNDVQKELLTFANTSDIYNICSDNMSDKDKVKILLEIFGFDSTRRGVDFLLEAIFASLRCSYYNLETLSELIAKKQPLIDAKEIQRLIVARVKENFKFKKAPTSDFIRLINNLIKTKGELVNE